MRYTIEEIRQMPEGQTFDCKSIHIEPKALANTIVAMANADGGMKSVPYKNEFWIIYGITLRQAEVQHIDPDKGGYWKVLSVGTKE